MTAVTGIPAHITHRIEQLRRIDGSTRSVTPPPPRSAKLELTSGCNFSCGFCASLLRRQPRQDMPWPVFTRTAWALRNAGVEHLGLFYIGESFLYPKLEDAVRYAKRHCGYSNVFLTTNGSLATGDRVRALMAAGLDSLKFALNFADGEQLSCCARAPEASIQAIERNVLDACAARDDYARTTGKRCLVSASSLRFDAGQEERMRPLLEKLLPHLDEHYWLPPFGDPATWQACVSFSGAIAPTANACKPLPCWPLFTEAHVTADGRLSACGLDHSPRFHMSDLAVTRFEDGWHSPAFQALRQAHLQGDVSATPCARCVGY